MIHLKRQLGTNHLAHCIRSRRWFAVRGILYTGILARNPRCRRRRRIDEVDITAPVAEDQRAANCLEEAVRSFIVMLSGCRSSRADVTFRHTLPVFPSCSVLVGPLLLNSHHCGIVPLCTSSYCELGKFFFSKDDNAPSFKLQPLLHGGTLNSHRAASPVVLLVEGEVRLEARGHPQGFLLLNWGGTEQNHTATCMVLKVKDNDRRKI
ncbi:uncharacterized protein TNCV_1592391 [Trichonephila clavipes]|nr:uncharacterized protein TNCV_1592391 [Trichonephila clavipes]